MPKNTHFSKAIAFGFCQKIDGSKNAHFSKVIAFVFAQKSMVVRMLIFEGYSLCFCPKIDRSKNGAIFQKL